MGRISGSHRSPHGQHDQIGVLRRGLCHLGCKIGIGGHHGGGHHRGRPRGVDRTQQGHMDHTLGRRGGGFGILGLVEDAVDGLVPIEGVPPPLRRSPSSPPDSQAENKGASAAPRCRWRCFSPRTAHRFTAMPISSDATNSVKSANGGAVPRLWASGSRNRCGRPRASGQKLHSTGAKVLRHGAGAGCGRR